MDRKQLTAVAVVAIIVAAAAVLLMNTNRSDDGGDITIVDGSGRTITLDEPLTNVAVINSNVPKAMIMLGLDDSISCYYYGAKNHFDIDAENRYNNGETDRNLGTYYTPSVEVLIKYGVQAVICPVSSMTLYSSTEKACELNGIEVIRLDCNGDSMHSDLEKLSQIFGNPESSTSILEQYMDEYNTTMAAVEAALDGTNLYDYLCTFVSKNSIYNTSSDLSALMSHAFAQNVSSYTDLPTDSVTNEINDGAVEAISQVMDRIDVYLMRAAAGDFDDGGSEAELVADNQYNSYVGESSSNRLVTTDSPAYANNQIYVIESELMSGLYAHIGLVIIVTEVYGIEVEGFEDIDAAITGFQERYNQDSIADGAPLVYRYGADHPATGDNLLLSYNA